ncbi:hypothetical protein C5167_000935 [Papaver somniferum]|uniref:Uncharacterized protein n=1 Tax=Papaver somniferum TaxID=3469 RepID=A0A4Y7KX48_PAPSO|nr:hypothetical protein C5167_000935 [Papaver somniferum]
MKLPPWKVNLFAQKQPHQDGIIPRYFQILEKILRMIGDMEAQTVTSRRSASQFNTKASAARDYLNTIFHTALGL